AADLTPVPGVPDVLLGVTSFRGEILAVFDLAAVLGLAARGAADRPRLIVLGGGRAELGVPVDHASEVTRLRIDEVLEPPGPARSADRRLLRGVTRDALAVLDGEAL